MARWTADHHVGSWHRPYGPLCDVADKYVITEVVRVGSCGLDVSLDSGYRNETARRIKARAQAAAACEQVDDPQAHP